MVYFSKSLYINLPVEIIGKLLYNFAYWSTKHKRSIPHCRKGRNCICLHTHFHPYRQCGIRRLNFVLQHSAYLKIVHLIVLN
jgi:hypothetical protein